MRTYAAFLRGINVGGHNKLPMAELREALAANGFAEPKTLLQSGNAIFEHEATKVAAVETAVHDVIADRFGYDLPVVVRKAADIDKALAASPYADIDVEPKWKFVAYLSKAPTKATLAKVDYELFSPDLFTVIGNHAYVVLPSGADKSKLTTNHLEKVLGVQATLRNHNTVSKVSKAISDR